MNTQTSAVKTASKKIDIRKLTGLALFIALGYICLFVFRFKVSFLTLDFKDVFITMAGFVYGPLAAACVALVESILELFTVATTGPWGALQNFFGSASFAVIASLIYKYNKSFKGAIVGLVSAVVGMTAVMMGTNLLIVPIYTGTTTGQVAAMIPKLFLPFNLVKAVLNASLTFILYKPLSQALKAAKLMPKTDDKASDNSGKPWLSAKSAVGLVIAAAVIVAAVLFLVHTMGGNFEAVKK